MWGYLDEKIFKGSAVLSGNNGIIQAIFYKKPQSSTMAALTWLLMKIVPWWGDFGQVGTCGVRSNPGLGHSEEFSVIVKNKFCNDRVYVVYGSDVCVSDMQTIGWYWIWVDITSKQE